MDNIEAITPEWLITDYNGKKLDIKYWPAIKEIFETHSLKLKAYPVSIDFEGQNKVI